MIDLERPQHIHVVGIGGAGMSAIATVLTAMGHTVSGSDARDSAVLARIGAAGVTTRVGHTSDEIAGADAVTVSTAIRDTNPAVVAARAASIPVYTRAEMLAAICAQRATIAVAGTHGKTTTTSMLALMLVEAGWNPSFIIGGEVNEIGGGGVWGTGKWFVVEADESDGTFLQLPRQAAIITNVAADHLDFYGDYDAVRDAFARFARETDGPVVVGDAPDLLELVEGARNVISVGLDEHSRYTVDEIERERSTVRFRLRRGGHALGNYTMPTPGLHNVRNAAVATAMALELGVPVDATQHALSRFTGVARRFQFRGTYRGVDYVDDYAHLPDEVAVAIAAARDGKWERIVAVFQPHLYSRTQLLAPQFAHAFDGADHVIVTDIYGSREAPVPGVTGHLIVEAVRAANP
ncbi:MAG TPA: UDP-N-acetylmuramate--L-alanine ligase, partial [Acidimicrobiales bacterium]|nr:UDP-N-acetylmuramate--L-alanine ligase [Acidimicrobiales bacterium]